MFLIVPTFAFHAVILFLLLSGYGLSMSLHRKPLTAGSYFTKRLSRVMIPYWIATALFLILDYLLLERVYTLKDVLLTLVGYNLSPQARQIDYSRWFVTLIIIWYMVFFFANRFLSMKRALGAMGLFSLIMIVFQVTKIFPLGNYNHALAFPAGCAIAIYHERICAYIEKHPRLIRITVPASIALALLFVYLEHFSFNVLADQVSAPLKLIRLGFPLLAGTTFCLALILLFSAIGRRQFASRFLLFTGTISYELYLFHGPFLIKYNPIFKQLSTRYIVIAFLAWLVAIILLSWLVNRLIRVIYDRQWLPNSINRMIYIAAIHLVILVLLLKTDFMPRLAARLGLGFTEQYQTMLCFHKRIAGQIPDRSVLFIGDSNIQGLCVSAVVSNGVNLGIGTDTTIGVIQRLPLYTPMDKTQAIVLAIGQNDLATRRPDEVAASYQTILTMIPDHVPVVVSGALPIDSNVCYRKKNQNINQLNVLLNTLCKTRPKTIFMDLGSELINNQGDLVDQYHGGDGVHLNASGYAIWIKLLKKALNELPKT